MPLPLDHMKATVQLEIDGLALLCFNRGTTPPLWEIGFLQDPHHDLRIQITKHFRDSSRKPKQLLSPHEGVNISGAPRIEVTTIRAKTSGMESWQDDNAVFDRKKTIVHPEDFRWIPDLSDLSGVIKTKPISSPPRITLATIQNAIFYTKSRSLGMLHLSEVPASSLPKDLSSFGFTNAIVGGDIECDEGGCVEIKVQGIDLGIPQPILLSHDTTYYYVVSLTNLDNGTGPGHLAFNDLVAGDMEKYYDILEVPAKRKAFAIWGLPKDSETVTRIADCHAAYVSNVPTLGPLVDANLASE